jgi:hypothetical protein
VTPPPADRVLPRYVVDRIAAAAAEAKRYHLRRLLGIWRMSVKLPEWTRIWGPKEGPQALLRSSLVTRTGLELAQALDEWYRDRQVASILRIVYSAGTTVLR